MLDVEELEQRWKRYNRKKKKPFYLLFMVLIVIVMGVLLERYNYIDIKDKFLSIFKDYNITSNQQQKVKHYPVVQKQSAKQYLLNDTINEPILSSIKTQQVVQKDDLNPLEEDDLYIEKDISKPIVKKKALNIIQVSSTKAYKDVERRFKRTHNINDSMFLANIYYKKRNYKKAIYWSMQTNKLDRNIEESWLIFAKSKVKLGRKNEAIRVLRAYIKRSNSYEAKKLLKKIMY